VVRELEYYSHEVESKLAWGWEDLDFISRCRFRFRSPRIRYSTGLANQQYNPSLSPPRLSSNRTKRGQAALSRVAAMPYAGGAATHARHPWQISHGTLAVLVQSPRAVKRVRRCSSPVSGVEILAQWGLIGFSGMWCDPWPREWGAEGGR